MKLLLFKSWHPTFTLRKTVTFSAVAIMALGCTTATVLGFTGHLHSPHKFTAQVRGVSIKTAPHDDPKSAVSETGTISVRTTTTKPATEAITNHTSVSTTGTDLPQQPITPAQSPTPTPAPTQSPDPTTHATAGPPNDYTGPNAISVPVGSLSSWVTIGTADGSKVTWMPQNIPGDTGPVYIAASGTGTPVATFSFQVSVSSTANVGQIYWVYIHISTNGNDDILYALPVTVTS